jgi:2-amino-4-hydroxy-6-hydroxymethyldihydropteridine diphosphokinase
MATNPIVYISVGSNLGNKLENCRNGVEALIHSGSSRLLAQSRIYKTEPVDFRDQDWFVNYVIKIDTSLKPLALLSLLQKIQQDAGRIQDTVRFGPRKLDLDILLYGDLIVNSPDLEIPHPRMHKRRFVLRPFCDIDSGVVHPVFKENMHSLLSKLKDKNQKVVEFK